MKEIIDFYAKDGVILNGYINKIKNSSKNLLIQVHGMTSNCFKKRDKIIAKEVEQIGIDTLCFNNRGSEIIKYIEYKDGKRTLGGTAYEDIEDSYYDILGTIEYAIELGYKDIYLQGHSLGATKVLYAYSKMQKEENIVLKNIKGIILLSLVDIPGMANTFCKEEDIKYAFEKESKNELLDLMPEGSFLHTVSVKTFLRYLKYNKNIDFARFDKENDEFEVLNNISVPLFMRWGNVNELIKQDAKVLIDFLNKKIRNSNKNIGYIDSANHNYTNKEEVLAKEISKFFTCCQ